MKSDEYKPCMCKMTLYASTNKRSLEQAGHEVAFKAFGNPDYLEEERITSRIQPHISWRINAHE
jgi:hypothetical protein